MANNAIIDYRLVCRTCLSSDGDFYKLDAPIINDETDDERVSLMECLRYCTRLVDEPEFPIYICTECSAALQVAYNFIQNAIDAHKILRQKLCTTTHQNNNSADYAALGKENSISCRNSDRTVDSEDNRRDSDGGETVMKYRCKICLKKLDSMKSLKEHAKTHLDIISYNCELCPFESKKRTLLSEHYTTTHGVQATEQQLKYRTEPEKKAAPPDEAQDFLYTSEYFTPVATTALPPMPTTTARTDIDVEEELLKLSSNCEEVRVVGPDGGQVAIVTGSVITTEASAANELSLNGIMDGTMDGGAGDGVVEYHMGNEMSVGNQFIVLSDGTVQEVIGNDVVIEYINAGSDDGITLNNLLEFNNIVQLDANAVTMHDGGGDTMPANDTNNPIINMDVDDMIIEETEITDGQQDIYVDVDGSNMEVGIPHSVIEMPKVKNIKCKICTQNFNSQDKLKTHMLTHNEIPHFFCDQCAFYTFYKIDLTHHYMNQHDMQPTVKQLQPKNKVIENNVKHVYTCDMCLFESHVKANLRRHYLSKHQVEASEVQLRPALADSDKFGAGYSEVPAKKPKRMPKTDYPTGYNCKKCQKVFYNRDTLQEHYKDQCVPANTYLQLMEPNGGIVDNNQLVGDTQAQYLLQANCQEPPQPPPTTTTTTVAATESATSALSDVLDGQQLIDPHMNGMAHMMPILEEIVETYNCSTNSTTTTSTMTTATTTAATAIPSDAIPQIVETDNTFDNEIDFDFNGDALFEDFDDDNDADNDEFKDLLLTSDEEFDDLLQDPFSASDAANGGVERPQCVHCNKTFYSQYQFENHMFVHRGLAPYRCEMCTNLYNSKRALIRHYRGVHKRIPTRDMVQAKGDKVAGDQLLDEHVNLQEQKAVTLMCTKCPFESIDMGNLEIHLNTAHGINDAKYIVRKLPYECPRCIRSFASKTLLQRHLERNHSGNTIMQPQKQQQQEQHLVQPQHQQQTSLFKNNKHNNNNNNNNNIAIHDEFAIANNNNNHKNNSLSINNNNNKNHNNNNNNNNNSIISEDVYATATATETTTTSNDKRCTTTETTTSTTTTTTTTTTTENAKVIVMSNNNTHIPIATSTTTSPSQSLSSAASTSSASSLSSSSSTKSTSSPSSTSSLASSTTFSHAADITLADLYTQFFRTESEKNCN